MNQEQLQKGKQIDEWWKQVTKGIFLYAHSCGGYVVVGFRGLFVFHHIHM